jgi:hypothetical protein
MTTDALSGSLIPVAAGNNHLTTARRRAFPGYALHSGRHRSWFTAGTPATHSPSPNCQGIGTPVHREPPAGFALARARHYSVVAADRTRIATGRPPQRRHHRNHTQPRHNDEQRSMLRERLTVQADLADRRPGRHPPRCPRPSPDTGSIPPAPTSSSKCQSIGPRRMVAKSSGTRVPWSHVLSQACKLDVPYRPYRHRRAGRQGSHSGSY